MSGEDWAGLSSVMFLAAAGSGLVPFSKGASLPGTPSPHLLIGHSR